MNKKLVLTGLAAMLKKPDSPFFGNQIQLLTPVGLLSGDFVWSDDNKPAAVASMRLALKLISQAIPDNNRPNSGSPDKTDKPHLIGDEQSVSVASLERIPQSVSPCSTSTRYSTSSDAWMSRQYPYPMPPAAKAMVRRMPIFAHRIRNNNGFFFMSFILPVV